MLLKSGSLNIKINIQFSLDTVRNQRITHHKNSKEKRKDNMLISNNFEQSTKLPKLV